jgi:hypothetical protein
MTIELSFLRGKSIDISTYNSFKEKNLRIHQTKVFLLLLLQCGCPVTISEDRHRFALAIIAGDG